MQRHLKPNKFIATVFVALGGLLGSCGSTPAAPISAQSAAAPGSSTANAVRTTGTIPAPSLQLITSPQRLTQEGSVFFFVGSQDHSGQGLSRIQVFVDDRLFVDDPRQHNSYGKFFTAADNGPHKVRVVVTDALGQATSVEQSFNVAIARP